jgi:hypothetical protein
MPPRSSLAHDRPPSTRKGHMIVETSPLRESQPATHIATSDFDRDARSLMHRLSVAMRALVHAVPGEVASAADLERRLGVTKKVAWQVCKIADAADPLTAANFVPGADPMRKLIAAAQARRVPAAVRGEVAGAFASFEQFVEERAGDRASFLSMLGPMVDAADSEAGADVDRLHRRACFRAFSHFYGAQLGTRYSAMLVRKDSAGLDTFVSLRARMGLRRLRADATVTVDRYYVTTASETASPTPRALDSAAFDRYHAPILPAFCTKPLPKLRMVAEGSGIARVELAERAVGLAGAVDLVFGTITRSVSEPAPVDAQPHGFHTMAKNDLPSALLITDVLVHRESYGTVEPELYVYADPGSDESKERRERSTLLKTRERIECLGSGLNAPVSPDFPRRTEMLAHVSGSLGWDLEEFDVYRLRMEFPLMHSVVRVAVPVRQTSPNP